MRSRHALVIGAGTAGLSAATLLARDGWKVTLLERFADPKPLGAGILLQPTGLAVLERLGLADAVLPKGARVEVLTGTTPNGRTIMDFPYARLNSDWTGLGMHRGALFDSLIQAAKDAGVDIALDCEQKSYADLQRHQADLIVIATGSNGTSLVPEHLIQSVLPYPWGALWALIATPEADIADCRLRQRYLGAHKMAGLMPTGTGNTATHWTSFFWSLPTAEFVAWEAQPLQEWREQAIALWPHAKAYLETIKEHSQLSFARYSDVVLKRWNSDNTVIIGDAAHGMSPQLGQGANMAMIDASVLADSLRHHGDVPTALDAYTQARRSHLRYYQWASRFLTPLFQSHSKLAAFFRDATFPSMAKLPVIGRQSLRTLCGVRDGIWSLRSSASQADLERLIQPWTSRSS